MKTARGRLPSFLGLALLAWLAVSLTATVLARSEAILGLPLEIVDDRIVFAGDTPLSGRAIDSLLADGHEPFRLQVRDLDPEPTYLKRYDELERFLQRQDRLTALLRQPAVTIRFEDGFSATMHPAARRPLAALPTSFWELLLLPLLPLLMAAAALAQRPGDPAARCYALCALGYALVVGSMAVYSSRALALDGLCFTLMLATNHFVALVFLVGSGTALIWHYPRSLSRFPGGATIFAVATALAVLHLSGVPPTIDLGLRLPVLLFFLANLVIATLQWKRSKGRAVDRAMLRWFLLAWFVGIGSYVVLLVIPVLLGTPPLVDQIGGWIALLAIFIGLGFGITRFRLFYVNRAQILVWAASGVLVCLICALGILLLDLPQDAVLWSSLAVAGWVHVPLRDWIWSRFGGVHGGLRYELLLPRVLARAVADTPAAIELRWRQTLEELYRPQRIAATEQAPADAAIADDGAALLVPALPQGRALRLDGASGGNGVFTPADVQLADSLWTLFARVKDYRLSFQRGVFEERTRLAENLDRRIDRPLMQLSSDSPPVADDLITEARRELRAVVRSLVAADAPLSTHVDAWTRDLRRRCELARLALQLEIEVQADSPVLAGRTALNLRRVLRETITNVIRHAHASNVGVRLCWDASSGVLDCRVEDDGCGFDPETVRAGRGLHNLRARAGELGGTIGWTPRAGGGTCMHLSVPLEDAGLPAAPRDDVLKLTV